METAVYLAHGVLLLILGAFVWKKKASALRFFSAAVFAASLAPLSAAAALLIDRPEAAYLRWAAVPAAYAFPILLSQAMLLIFRDAAPRWTRVLLGAEIVFAGIVTVYFCSDTIGREPSRNALGIWDFPPGAAAIAAGFGSVVFTFLLLVSAFAPLLRFSHYRASVQLVPAGLLIGAALVLRGVLTVRTFADDPHSLVLAGSAAALSTVPLALFAVLAIGLETRRVRGGGKTSLE